MKDTSTAFRLNTSPGLSNIFTANDANLSREIFQVKFVVVEVAISRKMSFKLTHTALFLATGQMEDDATVLMGTMNGSTFFMAVVASLFGAYPQPLVDIIVQEPHNATRIDSSLLKIMRQQQTKVVHCNSGFIFRYQLSQLQIIVRFPLTHITSVFAVPFTHGFN